MSARRLAVQGGAPAFSEPVYITRALAPDLRLFERLTRGIFEARWFTNDGDVLRALERRLREHLDVGFLAAFCNGTTALQAALRSLDLRGEVVTTPFTFPATIHAIRWCGLVPVFADIDPDTYNLDPASAAERVTADTAALLPVHCFGMPCDVEGFASLAERHGLRLVYDAAHAFGVRHKGRPIGHWGDLSVLSFHATKVFHTAEGGAVMGLDPAQRERLALLRNFAILNEEEVQGTGVNGKLSELHAALGLAVLERALEEFRARDLLAERYRTLLAKIDGIHLRADSGEAGRNAYFPIEIDAPRFGLDRDAVDRALRAENVVARRYFHPLCSENPAYRDHPSAAPERLPNAHALAGRILCLPIYAELGVEGVERIVEVLAALHDAASDVAAR